VRILGYFNINVH